MATKSLESVVKVQQNRLIMVWLFAIGLQVCAFGNPEAALVQFSQHKEAKAAYSCPDAVFGNRFIRVFWHNPERQQENKVCQVH